MVFHRPATAQPARPPRILPRLTVAAALTAPVLAVAVWVALPAARFAEVNTRLADTRAWLRATTGLFGDPPVAEVAAGPAVVAAPAPPAAVRAVSDVPLAYGDHLRITFYESVAVALAAPGQAVATVYPRLDLSGEYVVDADGQVSIPRVGGFAAAGVPMARVQAAIEAAFAHAFGRPIAAHIAIAAREPVYVLGAVRGAGSFAYRPGMTVLQALGAAGGQSGGGAAVADTSATIESIRERQRLHQAQVGLARLLVGAARLAALRAGADTLAIPPASLDRLRALVSPEEEAAAIAGARATLTIERASLHQRRVLAERQIEVARAGLVAQTMRVSQFDDLIEKRSLRLRELQGIAARGSVAHFKLTDQAAEIAEIVARREDAHAGAVQAERQVLEAEIVLARIDEQHTTSIDREAASLRQQIDDADAGIAAMRAVIAALAPAARTAAPPAGPLGVTITRRTPSGPAVIRADAASVLQPGDVVEIGFGPPASGFSQVQN